MMGLVDKVVVAAGAATNIGAEAAKRLAAEGARVVVGDIHTAGAEKTAAEIRGAGGDAVAVHYDQGDEGSCTALVTQALAHHGRVDGLFANAIDTSIVARDTDLLDVDMAVWERTLHVGLTGYAYLIRAVLPHMLERGSGAILCTSSDASTIGEKIRPAYGVTKAGVNALVRHVANRWGRDGIRANALCPFALTAEVQAGFDPAVLASMKRGTPAPEIPGPAQMAGVVALLLSDDAAAVNGQIWSVNGGATLRG